MTIAEVIRAKKRYSRSTKKTIRRTKRKISWKAKTYYWNIRKIRL